MWVFRMRPLKNDLLYVNASHKITISKSISILSIIFFIFCLSLSSSFSLFIALTFFFVRLSYLLFLAFSFLSLSLLRYFLCTSLSSSFSLFILLLYTTLLRSLFPGMISLNLNMLYIMQYTIQLNI